VKIIRATVLILIAVTVSGCGYNSIQTLDEKVDAAQTEIEVQLQRRADLIPNLVETVKGYAAHEDSVFTRVANARASLLGAVQAGNPEQMAAANNEMTGALGRLIAIAEAYPQLKADQGFLRLQDELAGTENRVARARSDYTAEVQAYNTYIRKFPTVITAKVIGAKQRPYFEVTSPASRDVPKVKM
jgi:LemA protein